MKFALKIGSGTALALCMIIAGCGGGGGSSTPAAAPATGSAVLSGTAATGAALANANVAITNSAGTSPCQESTITTSATGSYTCTLLTGQSAPFFVVVTDPTGNTLPLVSVATTTPAAGATLTVNATPLTTAILAKIAGGDALTLVSNRSIDATQLATITANVVAQIKQVLDAIGAPSDYNPFSTSITAATASGTGNTADMVLDVVKVSTVGGQLMLSTISSPTAVALGDTSKPLTADASVTDLSKAAQALGQAFQACFALPTSQRVLATNTNIADSAGGPTVTSMADACKNFFASSGGAAGVEYLHNGYNTGQTMYELITSDTMTNARFSVPEIVLYTQEASTGGFDSAVVNVRYVDGAGNPANFFNVLRNIANSKTTAHPSSWWLVGNQAPVEAKVKLQIRRVEQFNASVANQNWISTFQTGIQFNINGTGPGTVRNGDSLAFARVSGPGLPGNGAAGTGLVYILSNQSGQTSMDLYNKTGSLSSGARCGNSNNTTSNCPNFWLERTAGITGTAAQTIGTNQTSLPWAQSGDNVDPTKFVKGAKYKIELFYGASTSAGVTINKTLLSDLVRAVNGVNLPWNTPGTQTLAALDPNGSLAGAQTNLTVDWVQNQSAQQIGSIQNYIDANGTYGPSRSIPAGATSGVLSTVPAFSLATPPSRNFNFSYRMTDDSGKSSVYRYNN